MFEVMSITKRNVKSKRKEQNGTKKKGTFLPNGVQRKPQQAIQLEASEKIGDEAPQGRGCFQMPVHKYERQ